MDHSMDAIDGAMEVAMDAGMPVDLDAVDLFGDPLTLATARPSSRQLLQRMDEMRSRGCCQKIAWSKQGTIASVSEDGRSIDLRYLRCHPEDGTWGMSEPTAFSHFGTTLGQIAHLAWASTNHTELAVIDDAGRVSIIAFTIMNRAYPVRSWDLDPVDDLHAVVGSYWLPLPPQSKAQYVVLCGPAVREPNGMYRYENTFTPAVGPCHPNPAKSALLCVTSNGLLKVLFAQNNNKIGDTTIELESISSSDELITHAAICSDKISYQPSANGTLYIALALASRQLRIIKATLHWGLPPADKQAPPQSHPLNPSIKEKRVAYTSWLQNDTGGSHLDASMTQLSILEMVPPFVVQSPSNQNQAEFSPLQVFAVRSHASAYSHELQSIVDVWEVLPDQAQSLHPAFLQLSSRSGGGSNPPPATRLRKLDPIVLNKIVLSIHTLAAGKVICFAFSDGTVQYRDRLTMAEIYTSLDLDRIMTLHQMGFQFGEETPCVHVAFSPTNCSLAQIRDDGKVLWSSLRYPSEDIGSNMQSAPYAAVIAGLTVAVSAAATSQTNYDDILAIARQFSDKPRFAYDWMMDIVRMLKIHVDYSEDMHHDQLVRNANLQLCLSILNHMGFHGDFRPRSFCGKFAMLTLNVRNIVILITIANNTPVGLKEKLSPLDEPEVVSALAGCVKWALDLLSWLSDSLFGLQDDPKFMSLLTPATFKDLVGYLQSKNEVALHLLLCSSTRGFVSALCRRVLHLDSLSSRAVQFYEKQASQQDPEQTSQNRIYHEYMKIHRHTSASLVKVSEFDRLLTALGSDIRASYQTSLAQYAQKHLQQQQQQAQGSGPNSKQQQQQQGGADQALKRAQSMCELTLLLGGHAHMTFLPVLNKFFGQDLNHFKAHTDPSKLFFADYGLLDVVVDDRKSLAERKERGRYVDVFKRVEIPLVPVDDNKQQQHQQQQQQQQGQGRGQAPSFPLRRRCVRCASIMEDVTGSKPGFTFVVAQQRNCSCGGKWALLSKGSTVG